MLSDHIHVYITKSDGRAIAEHENTFLKQDAAYNSTLFSKLIDEDAGTNITIHIKFSDSFELHAGEGVAVHITGGGRGQLFWIDKADIGNAVAFDHVKRFFASRVHRVPLQIPEKSTIENAVKSTTALIDAIDSKSGCIAVFIRHGTFSNRTGFMCSRGPYEPNMEQYENMRNPKVIREGWFTPLDGLQAEPMTFQFRNMSTEDILQSYTWPPNDTPLDLWEATSTSDERSPRTQGLKRSRRSISATGNKRRRLELSDPLATTTSKSKATSKAKEAYVNDDDQDDEEVPPPAYSQEFEIAIKQEEEDAPTACAAPSTTAHEQQLPLRDAYSRPARPERSRQLGEQFRRQTSQEIDNTGTQSLPGTALSADDELLRLQLEENELLLTSNRLQQQLRKNQLMRR